MAQIPEHGVTFPSYPTLRCIVLTHKTLSMSCGIRQTQELAPEVTCIRKWKAYFPHTSGVDRGKLLTCHCNEWDGFLNLFMRVTP